MIMSPPKPMEGNEEEIKKNKAIVESTDKYGQGGLKQG
jgi:hypothetical protein